MTSVVPKLLTCFALARQAVATEMEAGADETCALQVVHTKVASSKSDTLPFVPQCSDLLKAKKTSKRCAVGDRVPCPGSGNMCAGNECCPSSTYGKTFPCPSADPAWAQSHCGIASHGNFAVPAAVSELVVEDKDTPPPPDAEPPYLKTVSVKPGTIYSFATLAEMAYCAFENAGRVANFDCPVCQASGFAMSGIVPVAGKIWKNATGAVAFVGKITPVPDTDSSLDHATMQEGCLVSVRGSHSMQEWVEDFTFWHHTIELPGCDNCAVHTGFEETWKALRPGVLRQFEALGCHPNDAKTHIYTTGHSLGGAVATLAAFDLHNAGFNIGGSISFEAPRVGNAGFQERFNEVLSEALLYRVTFHRDIVVHVPPRMFGYQHTNPEIFYDTAELNQVKICQRTEDPDCSYQFTLVTPDDHCNVPYANGCKICSRGANTVWR